MLHRFALFVLLPASLWYAVENRKERRRGIKAAMSNLQYIFVQCAAATSRSSSAGRALTVMPLLSRRRAAPGTGPASCMPSWPAPASITGRPAAPARYPAVLPGPAVHDRSAAITKRRDGSVPAFCCSPIPGYFSFSPSPNAFPTTSPTTRYTLKEGSKMIGFSLPRSTLPSVRMLSSAWEATISPIR